MPQPTNKHRAGIAFNEPTYLPTEDEIAMATAEIRDGWTETEHRCAGGRRAVI